ncbi:MAG: hypothetical protein K2U26_06535 [Cyclobacteriaceae bacterium]|nr:hypothetical protein [Cyclobacteriaceae bacterium]
MKLKFDTNSVPNYSANIVLCVAPAIGNFEHSCTGFGDVSTGVAWWARVCDLGIYS